MAYADFEFYKNIYFGSQIKEADFNRFAARAGEYIDQYTLGKAIGYTADDKVKLCCCAVADVVQNEENGGIISAETVGKHTVTYLNGISISTSPTQRIYNVVSRYLQGTGLLQRV